MFVTLIVVSSVALLGLPEFIKNIREKKKKMLTVSIIFYTAYIYFLFRMVMGYGN